MSFLETILERRRFVPVSLLPLFHFFQAKNFACGQVIFMFYFLLIVAECVVLMIAYAIWQAPDRR
ncbi:MAG: hypothetical protein K2W95_26325 [Candidatus Obscuribacterales bacterium]|nr:hypothetical protein [Candidatus Obscuribacterales bacterium]